MGNFFSLVWALYWHDELRKPIIDPEEPLYTVPDPNQLQKPKGRTKDLIASKNKYRPQ